MKCYDVNKITITMKKISTIILIFFWGYNSFYSQEKYYHFPVIDGTKLMGMEQANELVQETNRLIINKLIHNQKYRKLHLPISFLVSGFLLHPITHEEGHRSVLTHLGIGSISQPIIDTKGVAKVIGVTDATLKKLRDNDLPNYIRLHTAGLESDFLYLNSLYAKLSFEEEENKNVQSDLLARNINILGYYITSLIYRKFSIDEFNHPELERDIVGHDIWGMSRHLHRPNMDFHRYTKWSELTQQERNFANRTALLSFVNLVNPTLFGKRNFILKNGNKVGFNINYSLSPFGDFLVQNAYYYNPTTGIKLNPYFIQYFNKNNIFLAGGIKLRNYKINNKALINIALDIWSQPKALDFNTSEKLYGISTKVSGAYKIISFEQGQNSVYLNTGISAKTKGFVAGMPSLQNDFKIHIGVIYSIY